MISLPQYKVMGEDGKEYGPVYAEQICEWIADERLEKKSPVIPPGARDWVFLGSLPEFADAFDRVATAPARARRASWRLAFLLLVLAGVILIAVEKYKLL